MFDGKSIGYIDFGSAKQTRSMGEAELKQAWELFMGSSSGIKNIAMELSPTDAIIPFHGYPQTFEGVKAWASTIKY